MPRGGKRPCPRARHLPARGMSAVMHTSAAVMRSAIQSSAASAPSGTMIMRTLGNWLGRMGAEPLEDDEDGQAQGARRRGSIPRGTGQASPSMYRAVTAREG